MTGCGFAACVTHGFSVDVRSLRKLRHLRMDNFRGCSRTHRCTGRLRRRTNVLHLVSGTEDCMVDRPGLRLLNEGLSCSSCSGFCAHRFTPLGVDGVHLLVRPARVMISGSSRGRRSTLRRRGSSRGGGPRSGKVSVRDRPTRSASANVCFSSSGTPRSRTSSRCVRLGKF